MTTVQLLIVCITAIFLVGMVLVRPKGGLPSRVGIFDGLEAGRQVKIELEQGQSVIGAVLRAENGVVTLTGARLLTPGAATKEIPGEVRVPEQGRIVNSTEPSALDKPQDGTKRDQAGPGQHVTRLPERPAITSEGKHGA